jgi:hypothetical protein
MVENKFLEKSGQYILAFHEFFTGQQGNITPSHELTKNAFKMVLNFSFYEEWTNEVHHKNNNIFAF